MFPKVKLTSVAQYWRNKLKDKKSIDFPNKLCDAIADITEDFSFAYMKEAFVATLLELARSHGDENEDGDDDDNDDPLDKYEFWRFFKEQVKILRSEMGSEQSVGATFTAGETLSYEGISSNCEEMMPLLDAMRLQDGPQQEVSKAASCVAMRAAESQNAAMKSRFAESTSVLSPIHSFAPLAKTKTARFNEGVWEWGS